MTKKTGTDLSPPRICHPCFHRLCHILQAEEYPVSLFDEMPEVRTDMQTQSFRNRTYLSNFNLASYPGLPIPLSLAHYSYEAGAVSWNSVTLKRGDYVPK
jgi:hypothetical protein